MPEFLQLLLPDEARRAWLAAFTATPSPERVLLASALGRVVAVPLRAVHPLPAFPRSTVDGFAVRAADTYGAGESLPAYLTVHAEVPMGAAPAFPVAAGRCALIHTGGMLPQGADAVVMLEHAQVARADEIEIQRAVAVGENVIQQGEDVAAGDVVIPAATCLRAAEIGGLAALGITELDVVRRPRVGLISSGDEVVPHDANPAPGQVRDVNTHTLAASIRQAGGEAIPYGIAPDRLEALQAMAARALAECEAIVITAGSSASTRDLTATVIDRLGSPGVLVHGINVRPGKPTILAVCDGKPVVGLPGNPVSALVIAELFVRPMLDVLLGLAPQPRSFIPAQLALNLASQAGREDWVPVRLEMAASGWLAQPVFGKSNLIFTLSRASGLIRIAPDATGLQAGESVAVFLMA
ncbi:MAG: gephyrin-like molybdotransferase Glp [Chloroflexota bacterium]